MTNGDIVSQTLADLAHKPTKPILNLDTEEAGRFCRCAGCVALEQRVEELEQDAEEAARLLYDERKSIKRLRSLLRQNRLRQALSRREK